MVNSRQSVDRKLLTTKCGLWTTIQKESTHEQRTH